MEDRTTDLSAKTAEARSKALVELPTIPVAVDLTGVVEGLVAVDLTGVVEGLVAIKLDKLNNKWVRVTDS